MARVLRGHVSSRNGILTADIGASTYELAELNSNECSVEVSMYDMNSLNSTITEHYPTVASISGTIDAEINSGVWFEVLRYFMSYGKYPNITLTSTHVDISTPIAGVIPASQITNSLGTMVMRLTGVQFSSFDLPSLKTDDSAPFLTGTMQYYANGIEFPRYFDGDTPESFLSIEDRVRSGV